MNEKREVIEALDSIHGVACGGGEFIVNAMMGDFNRLMAKIKELLEASEVHGHWIDRDGDFECSQCHSLFDYEVLWYYLNSHYKPRDEHFAYCPSCGAKMDEDHTPKEAT